MNSLLVRNLPFCLPLAPESLLMSRFACLSLKHSLSLLRCVVSSLSSRHVKHCPLGPLMVKEFHWKRLTKWPKDLPGVCVCKYDYFERKIRIMMWQILSGHFNNFESASKIVGRVVATRDTQSGQRRDKTMYTYTIYVYTYILHSYVSAQSKWWRRGRGRGRGRSRGGRGRDRRSSCACRPWPLPLQIPMSHSCAPAQESISMSRCLAKDRHGTKIPLPLPSTLYTPYYYYYYNNNNWQL